MRVVDKIDEKSDYFTIYNNQIFKVVYDEIKIQRIDTRETIAVLKAQAQINCIVITTNYLYSGGNDSNITIWSLETHQQGHALTGHQRCVKCISVSKYLYSGDSNGDIIVWDLKDYKIISILKGHTYQVNCLISNSRYLYSGSNDYTIRVWDLKTFQQVNIIKGYSRVNCFVLYDEFLYTGTDNGLNVYSLDQLNLIAKMTNSHIEAMIIYDHYLYSSGNECIKILNLYTRGEIKNLISSPIAIHDNYMYTTSTENVKIWSSIENSIRYEMKIINNFHDHYFNTENLIDTCINDYII